MRHLFLIVLSLFVLLGSCEDDPIIDERISDETEQKNDSVPDDTTANNSGGDKSTPDPAPSTPTTLTEYFPPAGSSWQTLSPDSLKWNQQKMSELLSFLEAQNTFGFIILYKGRIVTENYWNQWNSNTKYPIQSAGKSITSALIGIAQQEGLLKLSDPTSKYLGEGWSSAPTQKENLITLRHHLSMTTGFDENENCMSPECFKYKADAGERWSYHNAAYNLLEKVLENASGMSINSYTKSRLGDKIGLQNSQWQDFVIELSTRDMARFGLLIENKGSWNGRKILADDYFQSMTSTSNGQNKSYGYLWWLNGKDSHMVPFENDVKPGALTTTAPKEMFAAMGKGDKKIYIIPSKHLVVVRHGDDAGTATFGPSSFDSELWRRLTPVIQSMKDL